MTFTSEFLDEIRARVSLSETIGRRLRLIRRGREFSALCPFHNEKSPSFTINDDKGFFHCFGCGAHGDVIGFAMRIDNLTFPEAVERLAGAAGLALPTRSPEDAARAKERASLHDVVAAAGAWFAAELAGPGGRAALDYLAARGVGAETIRTFGLGWAPDARAALKRALTGAGSAETDLVAAGLLIAPEDGGATYDRFRGRVIFPIADRAGRLVGFGGRILGEGGPKYLNSPETPLFHKGGLLYNLARARKPARDANEVVVVEGYMDVIALDRAGFANAVAPLGTALTERQLAELWRLAREPVLCLDGDAAGQRAAAKVAERALPLLRPGYSLRFVRLPRDDDPDSLIARDGAAAFRALLAGARNLVEVVWETRLAGLPIDTPERRAGARKAMRDLCREIGDAEVRKQYGKLFNERLDGGAAGARRPGRTGRRTGNGERRGWRGAAPHEPRLPAAHRLGAGAGGSAIPRERRLLALVVAWPELAVELDEALAAIDFEAPAHVRLRDAILAILAETAAAAPPGREALRDVLAADPALARVLGEEHAADEPLARARTEARDILRLYRQAALKHELDAAGSDLGREITEDKWRRIKALRQAYDQAQRHHEAGDDPDGGA